MRQQKDFNKHQSIFHKGQEGQHAYSLPQNCEEFEQYSPPQRLLRKEPVGLPDVSEIDLTRHFHSLAKKNVGIDTCFYPLGSCTMKLNPRVNEWGANLKEFVRSHPLAPTQTVMGNLRVIADLLEILCDITGMAAGSLLPNAGSQGELAGMRIISAYHRKREDFKRKEVLIPDNAHGTNPATAGMLGYKTITMKTNNEGDLDLDQLKELVSDKTAGMMLTNPNTLGLFSPNIKEITSILHDNGALLFYDGANLNPILNVVRPGDMGFDVMHLNLHKTFSTPHGGGGPGSGPVLCNKKLQEFLPVPRVERQGDTFSTVWEDSKSIGKLATFHGNFGIYLRAYLYIKLHGKSGLRRIAEQSVLNANYLKYHLSGLFTVPFSTPCMHEFVLQGTRFLEKGIRTVDIAKRILDYGVHPPTIYFPLIIKECMLIEPTESESKETLDAFVQIMKDIVEEIESDPELVKNAPHHMPVSRLDETKAAKYPILKDILKTYS